MYNNSKYKHSNVLIQLEVEKIVNTCIAHRRISCRTPNCYYHCYQYYYITCNDIIVAAAATTMAAATTTATANTTATTTAITSQTPRALVEPWESENNTTHGRVRDNFSFSFYYYHYYYLY